MTSRSEREIAGRKGRKGIERWLHLLLSSVYLSKTDLCKSTSRSTNSVEATYLIKSSSPRPPSFHILSPHIPSQCPSLPVDSNLQHPKCLKSTSILLSTVSDFLTLHGAMADDQTPPLAESSSSFTTMSSPRLLRTSGLSALERRVSL
jgi:hypothetical protein